MSRTAGLPRLLTEEGGSATEPGRIGALYIQRNPDKLRGVFATRPDVTNGSAGSS
jgi:hypothetical protein